MRRQSTTFSAVYRFLEKVDRDGPLPEHRPDLGPCWLWTASTWASGYGKFKDHDGKTVTAHLWAYRHFVGPLPKGYQVDHLCRVRHCVNYEGHLEAVSPRVNTMRGEAPNIVIAREGRCAFGHELSVRESGDRAGRSECRVCQNNRRRESYVPRPDAWELTCRRGHARTSENHYIGPKGHRICRDCTREKNARAYRKMKCQT